MNAAEPLITVRNARKYFALKRPGWFSRAPERIVHAVDRVSLDLEPGRILALVGESGSGKTTLGTLVLGLSRPTAGSILWQGKEVSSLRGRDRVQFRKDVQVVFQDPYGSLNPRMTVAAIVLRPLRLHGIVPRAEEHDEVLRLLERVGLQPAHAFADRYPHELSGGQRQRVAIARALATRPRVIVADEPVSALDVSVRAQILNLLRELNRSLGLAMLFTTHDLGVVRYVADTVAVMYLGRIVELSERKRFFENPAHPYSRLLLQSALSPDPSSGGLATRTAIDIGEPPSPLAPPSGCSFRTRCKHAFDRCVQDVPPFREVQSGQSVACHLYP